MCALCASKHAMAYTCMASSDVDIFSNVQGSDHSSLGKLHLSLHSRRYHSAPLNSFHSQAGNLQNMTTLANICYILHSEGVILLQIMYAAGITAVACQSPSGSLSPHLRPLSLAPRPPPQLATAATTAAATAASQAAAGAAAATDAATGAATKAASTAATAAAAEAG